MFGVFSVFVVKKFFQIIMFSIKKIAYFLSKIAIYFYSFILHRYPIWNLTNNYIQRNIRLLLITLLTICIVSACGNNAKKNGTNNSINVSLNLPSQAVRVVKHAMGETKVPVNPQRVIVLGNLENVLALGIKPVGATTLGDGEFLSYLRNQTEGITKLGINGQPSLEKILFLKPDLILGWSWDEGIYEKLSQIAPTVFAEGSITWKEWLRTFAEALGKTPEAEKLLRNYNQRVETFKEQMGDRFSQIQVSVVNFWADKVRIYMKRSFSGLILNDIGMLRPSAQNKDKNSENLSLELIPKMEGDAIFLVLGEGKESKLNQFTNHPLWFQLNAVKQGKVYQVNSDAWISSWGIIGANRVLDDLFKYLVIEKSSKGKEFPKVAALTQ
ncbi:iron-siderophore ABC transporter substrate-binding protein [Trichocoleus sp. ST-U1]|uniref:ABC transporter substrate-binding protein n=2 Tax=Cyanobacteriota TaxID=1117 RepID=UPI0032990822